MIKKLENKALLFFCTLLILSLAFGINSYAATKRKKINSITIKVEGNIEYDTKIGEENIEITENGNNYYIDSYQAVNEGFKWTLEDTPQFTVNIVAEDGYYFNILKSSQVNIIGGSYVTARRENSNGTLALTIKLPSLRTQVYPINSATLDEQGNLTWSAAAGAGSYEVRFMRGQTILDGTKTTTETSINLSQYMTKAGQYSFRVRPINRNDTSVAGHWVDSNQVSIGTEQAKAFEEANEKRESEGNWVKDDIGYYFVLPNGSLVSNTWKKINGEWYYFEANGYMATGWKQINGRWYYLDPINGNMWKNTKTPDGYTLGIDGSRATR